ncbi:hypothetical protein ACFXPR_01295 [Nocardia tengchongensis]|uniref:hypothetical protein n=1 Tax=Nocardia tengchongensis TaxID=2055889 RepID=UPI0036C21132
MDMAGTYSNRTDLLDSFAELQHRIERGQPRRAHPLQPRTSGGPKKQLTPIEAAKIVAEYEAGTSMVQLKVEHHMAKRTVVKVLQQAGVLIRPKGGRKGASQLHPK